MASIDIQDLSLTKHHTLYDAIDPTSALKNSASGKVIFITGGSRGIGQATAIAIAKAGAKAVYITARSEQALKETQDLIRQANPNTQCAYSRSPCVTSQIRHRLKQPYQTAWKDSAVLTWLMQMPATLTNGQRLVNLTPKAGGTPGKYI
jgi:NADPH:quinone reductase-like Zn-dependent oxidoreductase